MIKHVGRQGDRKVAILFREVPGEDHMTLVVYPDLIKAEMHDALMKAIESPEGQQANNLGEALNSKLFNDGRQMLTALHAEGMIKKVQSETITVTPAPNQSVRLDELNRIVREMEQGEEAIKRMAEIDADRGYTGKAKRKDDFGREVGAPADAFARGQTQAGSDADLAARQSSGALDDATLATNLQAQAERMALEAKGLLAEAERMQKEANELLGVKPKRTRKAPAKKKTTAANAS